MSTINAFGDSVVKGVIYEDDHYRVADESFQKICERAFGIKIENKGRFGSTITRGMSIFEKNLDLIRNSDSKYVILEFGGNDCDFNWKEIAEDPERKHLPFSTIENFSSTYRNIIQEIKAMGKEPVLLSLPPIDSTRYFLHISKGLDPDKIMQWMRQDKQYITNWHERYNIEVFKIAIAEQVPIIDITSIFLEKKNYSRFLCADGIHPNLEGHKLIAKAIENHLKARNIDPEDL
ncbi:MAG: SGNH/GDSL hydrolase family protein [Clostridiales bacterium]|nr:SGNH/GDSL hydrolase family protein [Clostridiales bacterium]